MIDSRCTLLGTCKSRLKCHVKRKCIFLQIWKFPRIPDQISETFNLFHTILKYDPPKYCLGTFCNNFLLQSILSRVRVLLVGRMSFPEDLVEVARGLGVPMSSNSHKFPKNLQLWQTISHSHLMKILVYVPLNHSGYKSRLNLSTFCPHFYIPAYSRSRPNRGNLQFPHFHAISKNYYFVAIAAICIVFRQC